ncbi:MAG: PKD domain-containing protein, partial [bacterium]
MLTKPAAWITLLALAVLAVVLLTLGCGDDKSTTPNVEPTASFTVDPAAGPAETVFEFDASGSSDTEDSVSALEVRWDWESDGTWDTGWATVKTADHQYAAVGIKTITLEVKDPGGATDQMTRGIVVTDADAVPGDLAIVPAGTFTQGDGQAYCGADQRQVTLTNNFYLGVFEVTNQEYRD